VLNIWIYRTATFLTMGLSGIKVILFWHFTGWANTLLLLKYLYHLLTNFQIFFTGTLCGQFAIM